MTLLGAVFLLIAATLLFLRGFPLFLRSAPGWPHEAGEQRPARAGADGACASANGANDYAAGFRYRLHHFCPGLQRLSDAAHSRCGRLSSRLGLQRRYIGGLPMFQLLHLAHARRAFGHNRLRII